VPVLLDALGPLPPAPPPVELLAEPAVTLPLVVEVTPPLLDVAAAPPAPPPPDPLPAPVLLDALDPLPPAPPPVELLAEPAVTLPLVVEVTLPLLDVAAAPPAPPPPDPLPVPVLLDALDPLPPAPPPVELLAEPAVTLPLVVELTLPLLDVAAVPPASAPPVPEVATLLAELVVSLPLVVEVKLPPPSLSGEHAAAKVTVSTARSPV
jgi:hypothetical protein